MIRNWQHAIDLLNGRSTFEIACGLKLEARSSTGYRYDAIFVTYKGRDYIRYEPTDIWIKCNGKPFFTQWLLSQLIPSWAMFQIELTPDRPQLVIRDCVTRRIDTDADWTLL